MLSRMFPKKAATTKPMASNTDKILALSGRGSFCLLALRNKLPTPNKAITVKKENVYTPARFARSPLVTNKTEMHNKKNPIIIR